MEDSIMVIGGLGFIGSAIASKLSDSSRRVYIMDLKDKVQKLSPQNSRYNYCFWDDGRLVYWDVDKQTSSDLRMKFDIVITALRNRYKRHDADNPYFSEDVNSVVNYIGSMTRNLLELIQAILEMNSEIAQSDSTILIGAYSTNSTSISHQPLSYHLINSLFEQFYRYLSVRSLHPALHVFPIQIGVISSINQGEGIHEKTSRNRIVTLEDLCELILFLVEKKPLSLSGSPLVFTSGRNNMDVTAAFEGFFGNLDIRGKDKR